MLQFIIEALLQNKQIKENSSKKVLGFAFDILDKISDGMKFNGSTDQKKLEIILRNKESEILLSFDRVELLELERIFKFLEEAGLCIIDYEKQEDNIFFSIELFDNGPEGGGGIDLVDNLLAVQEALPMAMTMAAGRRS